VARLFRSGLAVSGPFVCRCLIIHTLPRLYIPLIESDMRDQRIRLSDRTSCFRPRKVLRKHRQTYEPKLLVEMLIGVVR